MSTIGRHWDWVDRRRHHVCRVAVLLLAGVILPGAAVGQGYEIDVTYRWLMRTLDDQERPSASRDTGVTLHLRGRVELGRPSPQRWTARFRWQRIAFAEQTETRQQSWEVESFGDPAAAERRILETATRYRPLLNFPQAGAYEAEMLGRLLAAAEGRVWEFDPTVGLWEPDPDRLAVRHWLRTVAPAWPAALPFAWYVGSVVGGVLPEDRPRPDGTARRGPPPWVFVVDENGDAATTRGRGRDAVYLPFADRLERQLWNQIKALALTAAEPEPATLSPQIFAAVPEVLDYWGGESRISASKRQRLLEHPSVTPRLSVPAVMGWLPVDGAVVREPDVVPKVLLDPDRITGVEFVPLGTGGDVIAQREFSRDALAFVWARSDLKRVSARLDDRRRLSDARREERALPAEPTARVVQAQRLREAEARRWLLANAEDPVWPDYGVADRARLNFDGLWLIEDHAVEHEVRQRPIGDTWTPAEWAGWRGLGVRTLVPSCVAVRFNATAGVPYLLPPFMDRSPRARIRLEAETAVWVR
jgi:hypothetical protein